MVKALPKDSDIKLFDISFMLLRQLQRNEGFNFWFLKQNISILWTLQFLITGTKLEPVMLQKYNWAHFLPSAKLHGQHVVFRLRRRTRRTREGGTFQENHDQQLQFLISQIQHVVFRVRRRREGHFMKIMINNYYFWFPRFNIWYFG